MTPEKLTCAPLVSPNRDQRIASGSNAPAWFKLYNAANFRINIMINRTELESGCFVANPGDLELAVNGCVRWRQVIGAGDRARKISLFYAVVEGGASPAIRTGSSEAILFLLEGNCRIEIGSREFAVDPRSGVHVRKGEDFRFVNQGRAEARWLISLCPRVEGLTWTAAVGDAFDPGHPDRVVSAGGREEHATGDRFYKLLVGPQNGSREVTQFIGMIPRSKAPEHFHTYEEVICILSGAGRMWTGGKSADVRPGSIIFLQRKRPHCLECTCDEGLELVGMFYPAGSPAVNYQST